MNAYEKISQKKPSGGKYRDNTAFGGDFSETTKAWSKAYNRSNFCKCQFRIDFVD